jgi:hypothetical protein
VRFAVEKESSVASLGGVIELEGVANSDEVLWERRNNLEAALLMGSRLTKALRYVSKKAMREGGRPTVTVCSAACRKRRLGSTTPFWSISGVTGVLEYRVSPRMGAGN